MAGKPNNDEREHELRKSLSILGAKYFKDERRLATVRFRNKKAIWTIGTAVILALIVLTFQFLPDNNKSKNVLYGQYMQVTPLSAYRQNTPNEILLDAINAYNSKDFKKALKDFDRYLTIDSSDAELLLAKNICLMETGQPEKSILGFGKLARENPEFQYEASWYMSLAYLEQNNKRACKKVLKTIPATSYFYSKAISLLKKL
jgi:tetratricopeptide (TPR) repeat protein